MEKDVSIKREKTSNMRRARATGRAFFHPKNLQASRMVINMKRKENSVNPQLRRSIETNMAVKATTVMYSYFMEWIFTPH